MQKLLLIVLLNTLTAYGMDEGSSSTDVTPDTPAANYGSMDEGSSSTDVTPDTPIANYGIFEEGSSSTEYITQPDVTESLRTYLTDPDTGELRVSRQVFNNVLDRVHNFPKKSHKKLKKVFSRDNGQALLGIIRRYGAVEGELPPEGLDYFSKYYDVVHSIKEARNCHDHIQIDVTKRTLYINPFCGGTRTTENKVQQLYRDECHMVSSLISQECMEEAIREAGYENKVKFPEDTRLWNFRKLLKPEKDEALMCFSDIDFILTKKQRSSERATEAQFQMYCENEANRKILSTLCRNGIWTLSQLGFTKKNCIIVRDCRPPANMSEASLNNTLSKEYFLAPKNERWNTHCVYNSLLKKLHGTAKAFFQAEDRKAFEEYNAL